MTTAVGICSAALLELGASPIASFNDTGDRARLCANLYPINRDAVLQSHTWNCAVRRVELAPLVGAAVYGYPFRYLLPSDWLRTVKLGQYADWAVDFRHEGRELITSTNVGLLRYVARVDEAQWDALLVEVMVARMKWKLAYPVTKSTSLRETLRAEYQLQLQQAKSIDSMGEPTETIAEESPLITIRG